MKGGTGTGFLNATHGSATSEIGRSIKGEGLANWALDWHHLDKYREVFEGGWKGGKSAHVPSGRGGSDGKKTTRRKGDFGRIRNPCTTGRFEKVRQSELTGRLNCSARPVDFKKKFIFLVTVREKGWGEGVWGGQKTLGQMAVQG